MENKKFRSGKGKRKPKLPPAPPPLPIPGTSSEKSLDILVPTAATGKTNGMAVPELASVVQLQSDLSKIARMADQDSRGTTAQILSSLPVCVIYA